MKISKLLPIAVLVAAASCSNGSDATDAELKASHEAGRPQAALRLPENSMEREKAVLAIRVRETRLRDAGFESCADAYIESAARTMGYRP